MKIVAGLTLLLVMAACVTNSANAQIIRVPQEYRTIQEAINAANPQDTILIAQGVYKENLDINKPLYLKSWYGRGLAFTVIQGNDRTKATIFVHDCPEGEVSIEGFKITNGGYSWGDYGGGGGIFAKRVKDLKILNNYITKNKLSGIRLSNNVERFLIKRNVITYNESDSGGGIKADTNFGSYGAIINNVIARNYVTYMGGGIAIFNQTNETLALEVINNTIAFNSRSNWSNQGAGIDASGAVNLDLTLRNNIIWGDYPALEYNIVGVDLNSPKVRYNDIKKLGENGANNNIDVDPLFRNTPGDLRLRPGSPCIDAGDPGDEAYNEPAPTGGIVELGAYGNTPDAIRSKNK